MHRVAGSNLPSTCTTLEGLPLVLVPELQQGLLQARELALALLISSLRKVDPEVIELASNIAMRSLRNGEGTGIPSTCTILEDQPLELAQVLRQALVQAQELALELALAVQIASLHMVVPDLSSQYLV